MGQPKSASPELITSLQEMELDMGYTVVTVPKGAPEKLKGHILGRIPGNMIPANQVVVDSASKP